MISGKDFYNLLSALVILAYGIVCLSGHDDVDADEEITDDGKLNVRRWFSPNVNSYTKSKSINSFMSRNSNSMGICGEQSGFVK